MSASLTRILATIGPASDSPEMLAALFRNGVNACRLNFSHGSHQEHANRILTIRRVAQETGIPVCIVMDLCGPKVRTDNQPYQIQKGELWKLVPGSGNPEERRIGITHPRLHRLVPARSRILLDDGKFEFLVVKVLEDGLECEVQESGLLKPRKAVNTPGIDNELSVLSEKDVNDLRFGMAQGVDWVAVSFVRSAWDMQQVRNFLNHNGYDAPLIAKIETPLAMGNLEEIILASDGVMVARGDLGIECPMEEIPLHQSRILNLAHQHGKLSIVATQMLESMIENPRPTRAEITDIAHAVTEGTHAVMLSGETTTGKYPLEAVQVMHRTLVRTESGLRPIPERPEGIQPADEVLWAAVKIQARTNAQCIVVLCANQKEVATVASLQGRAPVYSVCTNAKMLQRSNLFFGIFPLLVPEQESTEETIKFAMNALKERKVLQAGLPVVFVYEHHSALRLLEP